MPTKFIILKDINGIYNCLIADDALRSYFENSATDNQPDNSRFVRFHHF